MAELSSLKVGDFVGFISAPKLVPVRVPECHYMLRLHPNYELKAERQLLERGIEVYLPKEPRSVKGVWNRRILRMVPIFAGILFVPDFNANLSLIKDIADGVGGFIKRDGQALAVRPYWMDKIRKFEEKIQDGAATKRKFKVDQQVRIIGGQFDMWEGKIARLDRHHRLRVLLTIFEREVPVEFDEDQVEAV